VKNEITAGAAIMFRHYFYAHQNVMIFFMSTAAAAAAAAAHHAPAKGCKSEARGNNIAFIIAALAKRMENRAPPLSTAALHAHSLSRMRRVKWTHPVSARLMDFLWFESFPGRVRVLHNTHARTSTAALSDFSNVFQKLATFHPYVGLMNNDVKQHHH
jgi:hypothetical protein